MSIDPTLYRDRPAIKEAIKELDATQHRAALRLGYVPSTFTNKINGLSAMDSAEEKKILADLAAMKGEA